MERQTALVLSRREQVARLDTEVEAIRERLRHRFGEAVSPDAIDDAIDGHVARWADAPVLTFVALLVERQATDELRRATGHGVQATQAGHGVQATQGGHGVQATQAGHGVQATQAGSGTAAAPMTTG